MASDWRYPSMVRTLGVVIAALYVLAALAAMAAVAAVRGPRAEPVRVRVRRPRGNR